MTMRIYIDDQEITPTDGDVLQALDQVRSHCREQGRIVVQVAVDHQVVPESELAGERLAELQAEVLHCLSEDSWSLVAESFDHGLAALDQVEAYHDEVAEQLDQGERQAAMHVLGEVLRLWSQLQQVLVQGLTLLDLDLKSLGLAGEPERTPDTPSLSDTTNVHALPPGNGVLSQSPGPVLRLAGDPGSPPSSFDPAAKSVPIQSAEGGDSTGGQPQSGAGTPRLADRAIGELRNQLEEIRQAVQASDWVRLADCVGYTMDSVVDDWRRLLKSLHATIDELRPGEQSSPHG